VALAPAHAGRHDVEALVAALGIEVARERQGDAPHAAADVEHVLVRLEAGEPLEVAQEGAANRVEVAATDEVQPARRAQRVAPSTQGIANLQRQERGAPGLHQ
jgi:hypothetical protein